MLKIGDQLPTFELLNQDGKPVSSGDFLGKKLVVFFYPKASTPTCTVEACNLNDNLSSLKDAGYEVIGISADSVARQKKFSEKFKFKYDVLSDEEHAVIEKFGVWQMKKFMGREFMGIVRTTFIFDENGVCTRVIEKVNSKEAARQVLEG